MPAFLEHLRNCGVVRKACALTPVGRTTAYKFKDENEDFDSAWKEALKESCELFEIEARRRALEGLVQKKFTGKGEPIIDPETGQQYVERMYSDTLLIFLMKGANPEKYRDNHRHEVVGKDGGPVQVHVYVPDNGRQDAA